MHGEMSEKIRDYAERKYVVPARREGKKRFSIAVREVLDSMVEREGLPRQNAPQVCQALRSPRKFLRPLGLEIEEVEGPEKQTSTTVVFHYRFQNEPRGGAGYAATAQRRADAGSAALATLQGLLREELAEHGGGEAFLRWLRTDPETSVR